MSFNYLSDTSFFICPPFHKLLYLLAWLVNAEHFFIYAAKVLNKHHSPVFLQYAKSTHFAFKELQRHFLPMKWAILDARRWLATEPSGKAKQEIRLNGSFFKHSFKKS